MKFKQIISNKIFVFMVLFIFFEGFVELCMSQWASMFAESGLGVSKALGDLLGPGLITLGFLISRSILHQGCCQMRECCCLDPSVHTHISE